MHVCNLIPIHSFLFVLLESVLLLLHQIILRPTITTQCSPLPSSFLPPSTPPSSSPRPGPSTSLALFSNASTTIPATFGAATWLSAAYTALAKRTSICSPTSVRGCESARSASPSCGVDPSGGGGLKGKGRKVQRVRREAMRSDFWGGGRADDDDDDDDDGEETADW